MKRWLIWCAVLLTLLTGCTAQPEDTTTGQTETQQPSTQGTTAPPLSLYLMESDIEKKTNGAVKAYQPQKGTVTGIGFMGQDVVVFSADDNGSCVTRLDAVSGTVKASAQLPCVVDGQSGAVAMSENRLVFYHAEENCCRILSADLVETDRVKMPEELTGIPLISADLTQVYYCTGGEVRSMNLQTAIPRLVTQINGAEIRLDALLFDDTVFSCNITNEAGEHRVEFFDTASGRSLGMDETLSEIQTWEESYLLRRRDWTTTQVLVGSGDGDIRQFQLPDVDAELYVLEKQKQVAVLSAPENGGMISLYDLSDGHKTAELLLDGQAVCFPSEDPSGQRIWFVSRGDTDILCCWDHTATGGGDTTVRIGVRYTHSNPDTVGLAACEQLAQTLEEKYKVEIWLTTQPVAPEDYTFVYEYQVPAYIQALQALDTAMAKYPDGFFRKLASVYNNRKLHISLVRSMTAAAYDGPDTSEGMQYWIDGSGYIALVVGDRVEQNFHRELSHALDTYVYSYSIHYDFWEDCNPEGFQYDECYTLYRSHADSEYLRDETRAFIDAYSMTYAHEDRARVMEYAMMDGNEAYFATETMQAKLKQLCLGIRQAFGWKKYEGTFLWEQYLQESLAYVESK